MVPPPAGLTIKLKWIVTFEKPIFQPSTIPLFHYWGKFGRPKIPKYFQQLVEITRRLITPAIPQGLTQPQGCREILGRL